MDRKVNSFAELLTRTWPWPKSSFELPRLQLHRGGHLYGEVENTTAALLKAQELGARMVEFDVRLTKDSEVVLFHDDDLASVGKPHVQVSSLTHAELNALIPCDSLSQVLLHPGLTIAFNIELKTKETWRFDLEKKVMALVRRSGAGPRILFSSFNPLSLAKLSILAPSVPRALLVAKNMPDHPFLQNMLLAPVTPVQVLHLEKTRLPTKKSVALWKARGVRLAVWTLTSKAEVKKYLDWGVDSVISDVLVDED